ncbi:hypothetical protein B0I27_11298 [Arcticibacter pallidicorallinus]|uniref:Uncharacterized protein n=1 Tax=Arcticibacter pallidicorallinus TaxID=1259464 RepID=A0A2T0TU87_9SPHI|nr:hypothetical protein B0I27_11298 [Arcticibacter pallidicorallinus]
MGKFSISKSELNQGWKEYSKKHTVSVTKTDQVKNLWSMR